MFIAARFLIGFGVAIAHGKYFLHLESLLCQKSRSSRLL
jgi:hypothetical protein